MIPNTQTTIPVIIPVAEPVKKDLGPIMAMPYPADLPVTIKSLKPIPDKKKPLKTESSDVKQTSTDIKQKPAIETESDKESTKKPPKEVTKESSKKNTETGAVTQDFIKNPTINDIIYADKIEPILEPVIEIEQEVIITDTIEENS